MIYLSRRSIILAVALITSSTFGQTFDDCKRAKSAPERISVCSMVIPLIRQKPQLERALLRRGNAFMELRQYADAVRDFSSLIDLNPKVAGYYDNRLHALKELGEFKAALQDANRTIKLASTSSFSYRSRGVVYDAMGKYGQAIDDFTKAISLNPMDVGLLIDRGIILSKAGRDKQAIADFTEAYNIDRTANTAIRERGLAYKRLGITDAAAADLAFYASIDPRDEAVRQALSELGGVSTRAVPAPAPEPRASGAKPAPEPGQETSSGSGFIVSNEGHIVTNAHVIDGCKNIQVIQGTTLPIATRVLAKDSANDLAILVGPSKPQKVGVIRVGVRIGEEIAAFGFPLHGLLATSGNFTRGNVSSVAGMGDDTQYLQISAPIQQGNSGGPVVDQSGNIVGVVVSKLNVLKIAAETEDIPQNVNFALKSTTLVNFLDTNGVSYSTSGPQSALQPADLAEKIRSFSVLIKCST